jgi:hypothetical protein
MIMAGRHVSLAEARCGVNTEPSGFRCDCEGLWKRECLADRLQVKTRVNPALAGVLLWRFDPGQYDPHNQSPEHNQESACCGC